MWQGPLNKIDAYRYEIPQSYKGEKGFLKMRTQGMIYLNDSMIPMVRKDNAAEQVANVANLPGIVGKSLAMPDIHWGYGFPIGGVAATSFENGVISPGGVGFDINCGVRLVRTHIEAAHLESKKIRELVDQMFINIPSGLGSKARIRLTKNQLDEVLEMGAKWGVENGYGWESDLDFLEENGCLSSADTTHVSQKALERGKEQVGSLGAGNHFLEIQKVDKIFDETAAKIFGVHKGQLVIMIHTGSRGCGHQICTDHLKVFEKAVKKYGIDLPDRQLACSPAGTPEADAYFSAMSCAANFAWCNRQMIVHWVRQSFEKVLGQTAEDLGMEIIYDVCHNIAKVEEHLINGKKQKVYVHRKGATRSFGPRRQIPQEYKKIGQPVLIPGDMGTASYLLHGTDKAEESFASTCHGAGRIMSRTKARSQYRGEKIGQDLSREGIYVHPASWKVVAEESPGAYKNVDSVVDVAHGAGLSLKVARMIPLGVVKG